MEEQDFGGNNMDYNLILILVLMFGMLYFFMIRPENKRKKEAENLRNSLAVGDEITTIGGMTGTICAVKENTVVFETGADRVRIEITKWAVSTKNGQSTQATR
ncbi:preprotein translocase subunit YajC [Pseudoflavonifractor phocaeensis]|nr:preprotein translocase subunit YajC [Pseudoflavonifractor phocaeensis]